MKKLFILMAAAVALSACSKQVFKTHTARVAGVPAKMESMTNISDLEVSEVKVTGSSSDKILSKKQKEENAIANALQKTGADILVEPQFTYTYNKKGKLTSVEVSGYPARYKQFRSVTREDAEIINSLLHPCNTQPVMLVPVVQNAK